MNVGKNVKGRGAPPPLPMYQPVVLKHVPTMVRRRYDKFDASKLDPQNDQIEVGTPSKDGQSEDDSSTEEHPPSDLDISGEDEPEDMENGDFGSEQGSASEDDINGDQSDREHPMCNMDAYVRDDAHGDGLEIPNNDHGLREEEDNSLQQENSSSERDSGASDGCQHSGEENSTDDCYTGTSGEGVGDEDKPPTDSESEDDGPAVANSTPTVDSSLEDGTHDEIQGDFANLQGDRKLVDCGAEAAKYEVLNTGEGSSVHEPQGSNESEDNILQHANPSTGVAFGVSDERQCRGERNSTYNSDTGIYSEDVDNDSVQPTDLNAENRESEDEVPAVVTDNAPIEDSDLQDEIQDRRHTNFSNLQDSNGEDNEAGVLETASDISVKEEALDIADGIFANEQVLVSEDIIGGDKSEDASPTSGADSIINSEAEGTGCISVKDEQNVHMKTCDEDFGAVNLIRSRSLHLQDLKSEDDGANRDMNGATDKATKVKAEVQDEAHRHSNNGEDFNLEAFRKTVEEDDYELCCPYCKLSITNTVIYQRRQHHEHSRTTCFTSLLALFCCVD